MTEHAPSGKHPLCTCPDARDPGTGFRFIQPQPDCSGGTIAHPPPLTAEDLAELAPACPGPDTTQE